MAAAQKEIIETLGKPGIHNQHLAVLLSNNFSPSSLGFRASESKAIQKSISKMLRLEVQSCALYVVVFEPESSLIPATADKYWESMAFYLKGCYRMNEFLKHANFMSESGHIKLCFRYLLEDVLSLDKYSDRYPD